MEILKNVHLAAASRGLQFVVIGGHAVGARGFSRATGDIDLMIRNCDREEWKTLLTGFGYQIFNDQAAFIQFEAPKVGLWPIDLMCSSDKTFASILAASTPARFGDVELPVPTIQHLIAMKLHALKSREPDRMGKDRIDVTELLRIANLTVDSEEFRQLCMKYGSMEIYEGFKAKT